jgi:hypothetical protein
MKTVSTFLSLLLFCAMLLLGSCNNCETTVAQFENGESTWTVYNQRDTLLMVDNTDTVRVFLNSQVNSELIPGFGFATADACIAQYDTRRVSVMQHAASPRRFPGMSVVAIKSPDSIRVNLVVVNRGNFRIPDINTPQHAQKLIGGITYENVFELTNEEAEGNNVRRVLFNRAYGFLQVEFADERTLTRWVPGG